MELVKKTTIRSGDYSGQYFYFLNESFRNKTCEHLQCVTCEHLEFMQDTKEPNPVLFVEKKTNEKRDKTFGWTRIKKECFVNQTTRIKIYANNGERLRSNEVESNDRRFETRGWGR